MGSSVILKGLESIIVKHSLCFNFQMTNNQVKYEALIARLKLARDLDVKPPIVKNDSQLVIS